MDPIHDTTSKYHKQLEEYKSTYVLNNWCTDIPY